MDHINHSSSIVLAILTNSLTPELFNSYKTAIPTGLTIVILAAIIGYLQNTTSPNKHKIKSRWLA